MKAKVDEEAGRLVQLRQNIEQEWAGRTLVGGACHRAAPPPVVSGSGQDLAAAVMLLRTMPEPSTTEGRRIQGELNDLLEGAAVRRAESSISQRRADPSEHHAASSRRMREALVHPERMRDEAPVAQDRLGNQHHIVTIEPASRRRCVEVTILSAGDAATVRRIGVPRPSHPLRESSAGPYDERRSPPVSEP
jgi:hypothetical protein